MSTKQEIIGIIDTMPEKIINEVYHYVLYLKQQSDKEAHNVAYVEKIPEGKRQCAEGRGLKCDIIEVSEDE